MFSLAALHVTHYIGRSDGGICLSLISSKLVWKQIAKEVNPGFDGKVSEYTVYHSLLCMGCIAQADAYPPPKLPTMGTELDHGAMEEVGLV